MPTAAPWLLRLLLLPLVAQLLSVAHLPRSCYIHIPFCRRRCFYCNFPITVVGERLSTQRQSSEEYTTLLLREMRAEMALCRLQRPAAAAEPLQTVYFGGGTPSLLRTEDVQRILTFLREGAGLADDCEVTLEMDPGTFDAQRLGELREQGVNRVSLGVQSFDDASLKLCGRAHSSADAHSAIAAVAAAGIDNFSIDLISSLPHMTPQLWGETLRLAGGSGCAHISVYDLQVEDRTAFGRWYTPGVFPLPSEQASADMYCTAVDLLTAEFGFEHYEVSNYARPGRRSRHNQVYWGSEPYYAFGVGAASLTGRPPKRFSRPARMEDYRQYVSALEASAAAGDCSYSSSRGEGVDILDVVMLSLRTADGLDLGSLALRFGAAASDRVWAALQPHVESGLVLVAQSAAAPRRVRLSDPRGFLLSNDVISSVFAALE